MLFAKLRELVTEVAEMKKSVATAVGNSELVLNEYQRHGTAIEQLTEKVERLRIRCPLMRSDTDEFEKVGC
jgi:hypothetical protein